MASGIYKIQSKIKPHKIYIGSAVNLKSRRRQHFSDLRLNKHHNPKLQHHVNKYGIDDLVFSPIVFCDKIELIPVNGVIWIEQCFIDAYHTWFNINPIAGSCLGAKRSEEYREKQRGRVVSEETKIKMRGWHHSEESKLKMSIAKTGRKMKPFTAEHKRKIGDGNRGKKRTLAMIENFSKKMTGRKQSQQEIDNRTKSLRGIKRTEETKKKMRDIQLNLPPEIKMKKRMAQRILSVAIVREIRFRYSNKQTSGETDRMIALSLGISIESVRNIAKRKTYKDIE